MELLGRRQQILLEPRNIMLTLIVLHTKYTPDATHPLGYVQSTETFTREFKDIPAGLSAEAFVKKFLLDWNTRGYLKDGDEYILYHNILRIDIK